MRHYNDFDQKISKNQGRLTRPSPRHVRTRALLGLVSVALLTSGCPIERLFPASVADGIARLSVANIGLLLLGIKQQKHTDETCDLFSLRQTSNATVQGQPNSLGTVTWTFANCTFDFKEGTDIISEGDLQGTVSGSTKVSGTKVIFGHLTGNPQLPVIPEGGNSLQFQFERAEFQNFKAKLPSLDQTLTIVEGDVSFNVAIHLGRDKEYELCFVPVPNITLSHVVYNIGGAEDGVKVRLPGVFGDFDAAVLTSDFSAQQNVFESDVNLLSGIVNVWGSPITVPSDQLGLNPDFNLAAFHDEIRKIESLDAPLSYNCPVDRLIAVNTARLLIQNIAAVAQQTSINTTCGFANSWVLRNPIKVTGATPNAGEIVVQTCIPSGQTRFSGCTSNHNLCELSFPKDNAFGVACDYTRSYVEGKAKANVVLSQKGERETVFVLYNSIIPRNPEDTSIRLEKVIFENYASYNLSKAEFDEGRKDPRYKLILVNGELSAAINPIISGKRDDRCRFNAATPVSFFSDVKIENAQAKLQIELAKSETIPEDLKLEFDVKIDDSNLSAQNGAYQGTANWLFGTIKIAGKIFNLWQPSPEVNVPIPIKLNPAYDQAEFDASYSCRLTCSPVSPDNVLWQNQTDEQKRCYSPIAELIGTEPGWEPGGNCPVPPNPPSDLVALDQ